MELIFKNIIIIIQDFFTKGHPRSLKAKKHISLSFLYRGMDVFLGLLLVPIVLNYLDTERYGIWLVLFSFTMWFNFMNIGLEQGLRNKFAESLARGEKEKARYYVSTCYAAIGIISLLFFGLFLIINPFLNWTILLNTSAGLKEELSILALFVFGSFSVTFILKIITTILIADQKPSIADLKNLFEKIFKFLIILVLIYTTKGSLLKLGISYSVAPIIILTVFSIYYFTTDYKEFRPSLKYVDFSYLKDLMNLGVKFFIINIAVVILFTTDNIIIAQLFGPEHVTPYEITKKYFGIPLMLFMIVVQPFWSAVTEAYQKEDCQWIKNSVNKLIKIWIIFAILTIGMLLISSSVYKIWIGDKVFISFQLSACWALFVILQSLNSIFTSFINGAGKIYIQVITSINSIVVNIPLSIIFSKTLNMGISGVIFATTISIIIGLTARVIQYKKIITNTDRGFWAK